MNRKTNVWANDKAQNIVFEKANLLNIITHYVITSYKKTAYYILSLDSKKYIQELITTAYLYPCLDVLCLDLYVFLALVFWLDGNTVLKKSCNYFIIYQKLVIFFTNYKEIVIGIYKKYFNTLEL